VIVTAEDRTHPADTLADRLHAQGATWTDDAIDAAYRRLTAALGGDVRAEGQAAGLLVDLARRPRRIHDLAAFLTSWAPALLGSTGTTSCIDPTCSTIRLPEATPLDRGWIGDEDDDGRRRPCPTCRPRAAVSIAHRAGSDTPSTGVTVSNPSAGQQSRPVSASAVA
jgi:hypothetical protein